MAGEISQSVAMDKALRPIRAFMFEHTRQKDLALFVKISNSDRPTKRSEVSTFQLLPAFVLSEQDCLSYGLYALCPVLGDGYGCRIDFDGYGYDDVASGSHLFAV